MDDYCYECTGYGDDYYYDEELYDDDVTAWKYAKLAESEEE